MRPRYLRKGPNLETQALDKGKESKSGRAIMASLPLLDFGFDSDTNAKQSVGLILKTISFNPLLKLENGFLIGWL